MAINSINSSATYFTLANDAISLQRDRRDSAGDQELVVTLPPNSSVISRREINNSTTIEITWPTGERSSWNSGEAVTCYILSTGFSLLGARGGPKLSAFLGVLASKGCSYAFQAASQDGDS
ncbi:hypothetical protein [Bordetella genomosp. 8]|uniref:hypothetical protein n=1 Tax=Bordetella genomosp. 8 TaxID=1416806 RepID=UPI0012FD5041|nr:hypothetical protein [Bordetella genomosp. 8]